MLSEKDKIFIFEIIKTASVQEIKEISRKCAEILSKESKTPSVKPPRPEPTPEPPLQGATNYSTGSASSDFLNEIRSRIEDRIKAAGGDKNAISQLSSGVIIPSQNPTALILRQMADQIDSGGTSIVKSDYVIRRDDNGVRTIVSVEIFEGLTK